MADYHASHLCKQGCDTCTNILRIKQLLTKTVSAYINLADVLSVAFDSASFTCVSTQILPAVIKGLVEPYFTISIRTDFANKVGH